MRHQDQQPIHYLNLDMNFLDMKKKLIRDESQKKNQSAPDEFHWTPESGLLASVRPWLKKRMKMKYGLVHFAITNK